MRLCIFIHGVSCASYNMFTQLLLLQFTLMYLFVCFCDQRDTDASYSYFFTVNSDTDFDRKWRNGPCGPYWAQCSFHSVWIEVGQHWLLVYILWTVDITLSTGSIKKMEWNWFDFNLFVKKEKTQIHFIWKWMVIVYSFHVFPKHIYCCKLYSKKNL